MSSIFFKPKPCMSDKGVDDDDTQWQNIGENVLMSSLRLVQKEVTENEVEANDEPKPCNQKFERNQRKRTDDGRQ